MFNRTFGGFKPNYIVYNESDIVIPEEWLPNEPYLTRAVTWRTKNNVNTFILWVGLPRHGKSYGALDWADRYCQFMNIPFDVKSQVIYNELKKFIIWTKTAQKSIFIFDETGKDFDTSQFWSLKQFIMRSYTQTQGFRCNVIIWVLPFSDDLQKKFKRACNYAVRTQSPGFHNTFKVKYDPLFGEPRKAKGHPYQRTGENFTTKMPRPEILSPYEDMKKNWNNQDLDEFTVMLNELETRDIPRIKVELSKKDGSIMQFIDKAEYLST